MQSAKTFLKQTHLLALEESFSVTVGKVQRQSHDTRSVLHSLNDPIQFSPAWTLWGKTEQGYKSCAKGLKCTLTSQIISLLRYNNEGVACIAIYYH